MLEGRFMAHTLRFTVGADWFAVNPSGQFPEFQDTGSKKLAEGCVPTWIQEIADRPQSERLQSRVGLRTDSRQGSDRQRSKKDLFGSRFDRHKPIRLMGIRRDFGDGFSRGQRDGAAQSGRLENRL